jgi:hypothetical protein
MRAAIVRDGVVVNIVVLVHGADWKPPYGERAFQIDADTPCEIGWAWGDEGPVAPSSSEPVAPPPLPVIDPAAKLAAFLRANPDVRAMVDPT